MGTMLTSIVTLTGAFAVNAEDITLRTTENVPAARTIEAVAVLERSLHRRNHIEFLRENDAGLLPFLKLTDSNFLALMNRAGS
jgi:hypothetical protein